MSAARAYLLALTTLSFFACGDDGEAATAAAPPGQLTGPCIQGQCYPGLVCLPTNQCIPDGGGSGNGSSATTPDPTDTGSTGTTDDSSTTDAFTSGPTTTADPPDTTTTGVDTTSTSADPSTSTTTTTTTTTGTTTGTSTSTTTGNPGTTTGTSTSGTTGPEMCGFYVCDPDQVCLPLGQDLTCLSKCDPLDQATCFFGEACIGWGGVDAFVCAPDISGNLGKVGDPCQYLNDCDPGQHVRRQIVRAGLQRIVLLHDVLRPQPPRSVPAVRHAV
ncbi:MAG TPA: hypothetical protein VIK91_04455 [Nannocystis sp.]